MSIQIHLNAVRLSKDKICVPQMITMEVHTKRKPRRNNMSQINGLHSTGGFGPCKKEESTHILLYICMFIIL